MTTIERILTVAKTVFVVIGLAVGLELITMQSLELITPRGDEFQAPRG
jgi:hypothetical protein